ncbi:MAG: hypothetical protein NTW74_16175 [Acidobacteria bacterium]|nr:hypothetical protein [Acidobacteriota bacterium]
MLTVRGGLSLPAGALSTDYLLLVQGQATPFTASGAQPNTYSFIRTVPMGPTITPPGGWSNWAYSTYFTDRDRITKPLIAELVLKATNEVLARDRLILIDKRNNPNMQEAFTGNMISESMGTELTAQGLDKLEALHRSSMPQPSLSSFNTSLTNQFRGMNSTLTMNTNVGNTADPGNLTPKACISLGAAPGEFKNLLSYAGFVGEVSYEYASYSAAKQMLENGSIAPALLAAFPGLNLLAFASVAALTTKVATACVDELPLESHFEVCASSIRGDSSLLTLDSVSSVNLQLGNTVGAPPPSITALNTLNRLHGEVNGTVSNFFFRYAQKPNSLCLGRPKTSIPDTQIALGSTIDKWRRCNGLSLDSPSPRNQVPIQFKINGDSSPNINPELNQVDTFYADTPLFSLGPDQTTDPDKGLCSTPGFRHNAETLTNRFYSRTRSSLDTVWKANNPGTQQAKGLDLIFSRWETGTYGDDNLLNSTTGKDHELKHNYNFNASGNLVDRMFTRTNTEARSLVSASPTNWIYTPHEIYPCTAPAFGCNTNQNPYNQFFDVSFSVTTPALNQVIKELSTSPLLTFNFEPTYNDLGISPAPGALGTDKAILDGTNLSRLDLAFAGLGGSTGVIRITPTIVPFTYINPQPTPGTPQGRTNLTYQLGQLKFEFLVQKLGAVGPEPWLSAVVDFYDPQLSLTPSVPASLNRLTPSYSSSRSGTLTLISNKFPACTFGPILPPVQPALPAQQIPYPTCATGLASKLYAAFSPVLQDRLLYMISRFPVPLVYDANGQGQPALVFNLIDKWQSVNLMTFYGELK